MAKIKTSAAPPPPPPGVSEGDVPVVVEEKPVSKPLDVEVVETVTQTVTGGKLQLELPVMVLGGYAMRRLDVRLSSSEAIAWKAVAEGLARQERRLKDGKYIRSAGDAVRWVGEILAGELG